jgi:hypothetical protein
VRQRRTPVAEAIAFKEELTTIQVFEEFLLRNHLQGKKMWTEVTKPAKADEFHSSAFARQLQLALALFVLLVSVNLLFL